MVGRRRICVIPCLVLVTLLFYAWPFASDLLLLGASDHRSLLLVQDALRVARDAVHESMRDLLAKYESELRTTEWNTVHHLGTKFEVLQKTFLDDMQRLGAGTDICTSLAGKRIAMIGGEHIYRLHLLLLQHRERAEGKPFPCPYHEFCTHHHICLPFKHVPDSAPQPRYVKSPSIQELVETRSAAVNYIVSDMLLSVRNESSWEYTLPFVDRLTGVRLRETYWLATARKAHVVILGRGPLSAPGETYAGNWSFLRDVRDYVDQSQESLPRASHANVYHAHSTVPGALEMLNAAVHLTISCFLPDLFQLVQSIRQEVHPRRGKRLIWPSSWYRLPRQGVARTMLLFGPHVRSPKLAWHMFQQIIFRRARPRSLADVRQEQEDILALHILALMNADGADASVLEDPWTLLFNAQGIYLQNMVLGELLPRYGIVFLPLGHVPWIEEADEGGHGHPHWYTHGFNGYIRDAAKEEQVDVQRLDAIGVMFLHGLDRVLRFLEK